MAVAPTDARAEFKYSGPHGSDNTKRATLPEHTAGRGGSSCCGSCNLLRISAVGHLLDPTEVVRNVVKMHLLEYLILDDIIFAQDLDFNHPRWHIKPSRLSKLFADLTYNSRTDNNASNEHGQL